MAYKVKFAKEIPAAQRKKIKAVYKRYEAKLAQFRAAEKKRKATLLKEITAVAKALNKAWPKAKVKFTPAAINDALEAMVENDLQDSGMVRSLNDDGISPQLSILGDAFHNLTQEAMDARWAEED